MQSVCLVFSFLSLFFLFYRGGLELQTQSQRSWWSSCMSTKDMLFLILFLLLVCPASGTNFSTWEDQQKCIALENAVGDLRMRTLGPQGHQQPLMALTIINLDIFLFYFQLFLCTLGHPAVLFVLELGQTVLLPALGVFVSCSFLTMSRVAPLHANYQAGFLWLIFAVPFLFELPCPSSLS